MINEFEKLCVNRKSIRKFCDKAIEDDKIKEILQGEKEEIPVAILPIGYTLSNKISFTRRKDLNELSIEI